MLKYIYGVMGSSKTAQALITEYNYKEKGFKVILLKPSIDKRSNFIESRIGLKSECLLFSENANLLTMIINCIKFNYLEENKIIVIVDECQFCTKDQIEQLQCISTKMNVFCYGLKVNINGVLFEGGKRLLEIADEFEEIESICECGKKAIMNIMIKDGKMCSDVDDGEYDYYRSVCYNCWKKYKEKK